MKKIIPWWGRIVFKIILSRLPLSYRFWKLLRLFEHGDMNLPQRALDIFVTHAKTAGVLDCSNEVWKFKGADQHSFNVLELGPGDSLNSGIISYSLGASHTWLVDTGKYATTNPHSYYSMHEYLLNRGYFPPLNSGFKSIDQYMEKTRSIYLTEGTKSLKNIPDSSIDFCFSNAVLEHIDLNNFDFFVSELKRIMKPNGVSCHRVDLKDHLGGGLNNLRFSNHLWESSLFKSAGFYTNRIRFRTYLSKFTESGFCVSTPRVEKWERLPILRKNLNIDFIRLDDENLIISGFDVVLKLKNKD